MSNQRNFPSAKELRMRFQKYTRLTQGASGRRRKIIEANGAQMRSKSPTLKVIK